MQSANFEAMKQVAETGHGPAEQSSIGVCAADAIPVQQIRKVIAHQLIGGGIGSKLLGQAP